MSKGQRGNKESKKPKKAPLPPAAPGTVTPVAASTAPVRLKRR